MRRQPSRLPRWTGGMRYALPRYVLLHLDVGRVDDGRPARNLALDQREERLRPALRLGGDVTAQHVEALARRLVVERLVERVGQLVDDRLRRVLGGEQAIPG